jgi:polyisoprenoid-binding protein YceI
MLLRSLLVLFSLIPLPAIGADLTFDPGSSALYVHVPKAGIFSFAGHEHIIIASEFNGVLHYANNGANPQSVEVEVKADGLIVADKALDEVDRAKVRSNMLADAVLASAENPTIRFESSAITVITPEKWMIEGTVSIKGFHFNISFPLTVDTFSDGRMRFAGEVGLKLADFGIKPVSALAGTVKTGKIVTIRFEFTSN